MKRSRNAIFKYTIVLGAAMSLSACNGIFENIYDAPIETEMEIKRNMRVKFLTSGISLFIVMI